MHDCSLLFQGHPTMIDEALAQFRAHRQNINRYRSLLKTSLTALAIARRIAEEESAVNSLAYAACPLDLPLRGPPSKFLYNPDPQ
jgi:hypothetical protein